MSDPDDRLKMLLEEGEEHHETLHAPLAIRLFICAVWVLVVLLVLWSFS